MSSNASNDPNSTVCIPGEDDLYVQLKLFNFSLTLIVGVLGLIGNAVIIYVNQRIKTTSSTDIYISWLAISDNGLIISLSLYAYRYVYQYISPQVTDFSTAGLAAFIGLLCEHFFQCLNTYLIVLLGVDRYLQVRHIAKAKIWCRPRRASINVAITATASALFTLPRMWEYIPLMVNLDSSIDKCTGYFKLTHGIGMDATYQLAYGFITYLIVMYAVPLSTLSFTSYVLISTICRRRKWLSKIQSEISSQSKERPKKTEVNAIVTLIIVTLSFMILQVPDMCLQFIWRLSPAHGPTASIFTYQLMIINSSINFFIYAFSSSVFRRRLKQLSNKDMPADLDGTILGEHDRRSNLNSKNTSTRPGAVIAVITPIIEEDLVINNGLPPVA